jgi:RND superfamily putative drug exporter
VQRGDAITVLSVILEPDPRSIRATAAIDRLRERHVPAAFGPAAGAVRVGGAPAAARDYNALTGRWLPIVIASVLALTVVLLTVAFRSVAIPLTAIAVNLLSAGAAYGLLVLVFQEGVGAGLLGLTQVERIEAWVPVFLFCVLFGLSMDYQVFLLSRIREHYDRTGDTTQALVHGVGSTARLITGAALIIVVVLAGFATGDLVAFQQMGFGVAVALLVDATIVRSVVIPAAMQLLGRRNWTLPRRLAWLPDVQVEGGTAAARATVPGERFAVEVHDDGGAARVVVRGELDLLTAETFAARPAAVRSPRVVVDLRELSFLDSAGLRELVLAQRRAREAGHELVLRKRAGTPIAHVLAISGVDGVIETVEDPRG